MHLLAGSFVGVVLQHGFSLTVSVLLSILHNLSSGNISTNVKQEKTELSSNAHAPVKR